MHRFHNSPDMCLLQNTGDGCLTGQSVLPQVLTTDEFSPQSTQLAANKGGEPDPAATRALAREVARLLWEWAQAGRPAPVPETDGSGQVSDW